MARPKKNNPVVAGQLKSNECRFTFIANRGKIELLKNLVQKQNLSIKDAMDEAIMAYIKRQDKQSWNMLKLMSKIGL